MEHAYINEHNQNKLFWVILNNLTVHTHTEQLVRDLHQKF